MGALSTSGWQGCAASRPQTCSYGLGGPQTQGVCAKRGEGAERHPWKVRMCRSPISSVQDNRPRSSFITTKLPGQPISGWDLQGSHFNLKATRTAVKHPHGLEGRLPPSALKAFPSTKCSCLGFVLGTIWELQLWKAFTFYSYLKSKCNWNSPRRGQLTQQCGLHASSRHTSKANPNKKAFLCTYNWHWAEACSLLQAPERKVTW